jgi:transcriptional regulator with XRE-family HTH domain
MSSDIFHDIIKNMNKIKEKSIFAQNLIRFRKERGLSQQELAEKSGLSQRMIVYYESEAGNPPINKIEAIAEALHVNVSDLLGEKKPTKIQSEFANVDPRTLKKIKMILSLTKQQRHIIYEMAESFFKKNQEK